MYRTAIEALHKWKAKSARKPLIIRGARQVGKTWLMREFGSTAYAHTVYISFDNNQRMKELFSADLDVSRLVTGIELYAGYKIDPENTLIIFDEVQEVPQALTSLKYFNENAPQYQIICAGSLLGVALHQGTSFPVGKVEFLDLHPLSFAEFMAACGKAQFVSLLEQGDFAMATTFKQEYIDLLKRYYYVGGMPEVVLSFAENGDFNEAREIQQRILAAYEQDFSKHTPHEVVPRIRMLWNSIPTQLTKENKKFIYGLIKDGARAREYEYALMWLTDCGLVHKVHRVTAPNLPLKAYEDLKAFKLFLVDVGLLSCMTSLRQDVLLDGNELFKEFKGVLTEQYVLQQLKTLHGIEPYYWTNDRNTSEIDFLLNTGNAVVPLEVKAEVNLQSKSLKAFAEKFHPAVSVRSSMADYKREDWLLNLPLYAIGNISSCIG
ncbi:MAG: ATP-binding protein [Oscillospiraceae bacterium]|jgi:predicted AAA+ superfamily ATPase|nr:ATP-binding protein [Oscillospiraceae bacterium]